MAVYTEVWTTVIAEELKKDNSFFSKARDESSEVLGGRVVHLPQAGLRPQVSINSSVPLAIVERTDTDITYTLDVIRTPPTRIRNAELIELSYDKTKSVLNDHLTAIKEGAADIMLTRWAPAGASKIIRTQGEATAAHIGTGTRKRFTYKDIVAARTKLNSDQVPYEERYILCDSELYAQLMDDEKMLLRDYRNEIDVVNGVVNRMFGFNIMERSKVLTYSNATVPVANAYGAAMAATDNAGALVWQKDCVSKAFGNIDVFERLNDPEHFGDIYSMEVRLGGRINRTLGEGVYTIVQGATA